MLTTGSIARAEEIRDLITHFSSVEGSVLRALQSVQETFGYVPDLALDVVADVCNVSRAEVYGVVTYYRDLRTAPPAPNVVRVCLAEACQASGSARLVSELKDAMGLDVEANTRNGDVEASSVFCLGNCALGPAVMVNGELIGRASVAKIRTALGGAQ